MPVNFDHILIFRSNVHTEADSHRIGNALDMHPLVDGWSIDLEDEEKILRIVSPKLNAKHITVIVKKCGYSCEELTD